MASVILPNAWIGLKLPSESVRFLQIVPNTTISLGKYGAFPSNLLLHRPYHLTYELQDPPPGQMTCQELRIVPASELYEDEDEANNNNNDSGVDVSSPSGRNTPLTTDDKDKGEWTGMDMDMESQAVIERYNAAAAAAAAEEAASEGASSDYTPPPTFGDGRHRQALTTEEIERRKKQGAGAGAGRALIRDLLASHAALDQKTAFSLAKYKLLKTKKYLRRFAVLPMDVPALGNWLLEDRDAGNKILDLRDEAIGLLGCWGNVHFGGALGANEEEEEKDTPKGRWLMVDDTGGLLVAAMAERMGILYEGEETEESQEGEGEGEKERKPNEAEDTEMTDETKEQAPEAATGETTETVAASTEATEPDTTAATSAPTTTSTTEGAPTSEAEAAIASTTPVRLRPAQRTPRQHRDDLEVPYRRRNTLTLLHANAQPNLVYLRYFGFDHAAPSLDTRHPLSRHLLTLSWLQLLDPASDSVLGVGQGQAGQAGGPPTVDPETLATWKPARRGNYHRKRRRWARASHVAAEATTVPFDGLVVATQLDLVSVLRHTLPLVAGGAPIAVYAPSLEPLLVAADCFSVARRTAWAAAGGTETEEGAIDKEGSDEFPLNPMLLLGVSVQTSRARKWQVLPGRTHPLMTARGGAEGYVLTGWKAKPAVDGSPRGASSTNGERARMGMCSR